MVSVIDIAILGVTIVLSILPLVIAHFFINSTKKVIDRLQQCKTIMDHCVRYINASEITGSVMQLCVERMKIDADVNEFEKTALTLIMPDKKMPYVGEIMNRAERPTPVIQPPKDKSNRSGKSKREEEKRIRLDEEGKKKSEKSEGKKSEGKKSEPKKSEGKKSEAKKKSEKEKKDEKKKEEKKEEDKKDVFAKPTDDEKKAGAKDPNYQTLNGMLNETVFGENKKPEKFKAPAKVGKADAKDPQYETLNGLDNQLFNEEEEKGKKKKEFKEPEKVKKADAKDPQYETLADVKDNIFQQ